MPKSALECGPVISVWKGRDALCQASGPNRRPRLARSEMKATLRDGGGLFGRHRPLQPIPDRSMLSRAKGPAQRGVGAAEAIGAHRCHRMRCSASESSTTGLRRLERRRDRARDRFPSGRRPRAGRGSATSGRGAPPPHAPDWRPSAPCSRCCLRPRGLSPRPRR